ncbi:MAG: beta-lactamase family protein [Chloroflexi bacterium]|nr:beta-lactamase family protein [Chloroflexota bacterium]MCL5273882.1 beta-lactamase family protein [Chloroflexota bacterium]
MLYRFVPALLLSFAALLGVTSAPLAQAAPYTPPDAGVQIDAYLNRITADGSFSGSVLVARGGDVLLDKGYGEADREYHTPNTPQTRFLLASVSKQFTAMAILLLQDEGKLKVRDRICAYLPACPGAWKLVTIHQLLTHTSGIPDYMSFSDFDSLEAMAASPVDLIQRFKYHALDFSPGSSWRYSNSGYVLLGYLIERVSGQSYAAFLQEHIFDPLRMQDSGYDPDGAIGDAMAVGYEDQSRAEYLDMSEAYAAGGLYSSVEDLYRWSQALSSTRLISARLSAPMFRPQVAVPGRNTGSYGYGWFIRQRLGRQVMEHTGVLDGFTTLIARFPHDNITLIVLCNQSVDMDEIETSLTQMLVK